MDEELNPVRYVIQLTYRDAKDRYLKFITENFRDGLWADLKQARKYESEAVAREAVVLLQLAGLKPNELKVVPVRQIRSDLRYFWSGYVPASGPLDKAENPYPPGSYGFTRYRTPKGNPERIAYPVYEEVN